MQGIQLAFGQITWRRSAPEDQILEEIHRAGYEGAPAGRGERAPEETLAVFAEHGLKPAPGYLGAALWDKGQADTIVQQAILQARTMRALGLTELYVAANLTPERRAVSGHVRPEDALSKEGFKQMAETLNRVGEATLRENVRACLHNHVGSFIETREEIDQLFAMVDWALVFQGADLGHLAWAGGDAVAFCRDYGTSIKTLHIKDINPAVRAEGIAKGWDYGAFSDHGIFAEIGEGLIDFPSVFESLQKTGFQGWVIVEIDVTQKPTPYDSAVISRNYLKSIGV